MSERVLKIQIEVKDTAREFQLGRHVDAAHLADEMIAGKMDLRDLIEDFDLEVRNPVVTFTFLDAGGNIESLATWE
jgi:hypothetical protein